jgi:hypothetical protein
MAAVTTRAKARNAAVQARLEMMDGTFPLSQEAKDAIVRVHGATKDAMEAMVAAVESAGAYDMGRLIAAQDLLQQAKGVACVAIALPRAPAYETPAAEKKQ